MVERSASCVDVREARLRGAELSPEAAAHAEGCPVCSADGANGHGAPDQLEDLYQGIQRQLQRERGVSAWLRSRRTPTRLLIGASWVAGLTALSGWLIPRTRFAPVPVERVVLIMTALSVLAAALLRVGLRPAQASPPNDRAVVFGLAAGLSFPVVAAFLPAGLHPFDHYVEYTQTQATVGCFVIGAVTGALVVAMLRALDRFSHQTRLGSLVAAVTGGVAGNLALELHCPVTAPAHLLLGHATVGLALVLAYGVVRRPARA